MAKTCEWCEREFKHQGALNLHKSVHCKKKPGTNGIVSKQEKTGVEKQVACEHEFRFLRDTGVEAVAKQKGYSEVCSKCQTLQV